MVGTHKEAPALPGPIGRYVPLKLLGRGGMAEVFLAEISGPGGFNRRVALKMVLPAHSSNPDITRMFLDEARVAANFTHPHVVQVYDFGEVEGRYFIAMEYARGLSLRALLTKLRERKQRVPDVVVAAMGSHACSALAYVHALNDREGQPLHIVHRDVTPENLFFTVEGVTKVLDFGIARATTNSATTEAGLIKGKPAYMSPEQANAETLDGRSDVFSLGSSLWEAVATRRVYQATDMLGLISSIIARPATDIRTIVSDVGEGLAEALMSALERERERRPTAKLLQGAFDTLLQKSDYPNSQDAIAAFLKGSLSPTPLSAKPGPRSPTSPGTPLPVSTPIGANDPAPTPAPVESISEWPVRAEAVANAATQPMMSMAPEWAAPPPASEESTRPTTPAAPPPARVLAPPALEAPAEAPLELARPARLDISGGRSTPAASEPSWAPAPAEPPPASSKWMMVGVAGAVVVGLIGVGVKLREPAPKLESAPESAPIVIQLAFSSEPPGAAIELDGTATGRVTPYSIPVATFEEHEWAVSLPGYFRVTGKVAREQLGTPISVHLVKEVEVAVDSTPPGASITCDGALVVASAPGHFAIGVGEHLVRAEKGGLVPVEEHLVLDADHRAWKPVLAIAAYLDIDSSPSEAQISLDGKPLAQQTPVSNVAVAAGKSHVVVVTQEKLTASHRLQKPAPGAHVKVALLLTDPALAASDARKEKLLKREKALEAEKDRLEEQNSSYVLAGANDLRDIERRDKRIEAIDEELDHLSEQLSAE